MPKDELTRFRRYQRIICDLSRLAATDPRFEDYLKQVVHHVARATDIDRVKVMRYRPDEGDLLVVAGVGWKEGVIGKATLPIGLSSPPGRAIQLGKPSVIADLAKSKEYRRSGLLAEHDIVSAANAPIPLEGSVWGVLEVDSRTPQQFPGETVAFIETIAHLIGAAVQRAMAKESESESKADLARELASRGTLLREMQHRVKNNFQGILSMIIAQRMQSHSEEAGRILQLLADRITAISLAHDQLDAQHGLQDVSMRRYLTALCRNLGEFSDDVSVEAEIEDVQAHYDVAVALGLVVNELVVNALKHAFSGPGAVVVRFQAGEGTMESCLAVRDNGRGLKAGAKSGSGIGLVDALAAQLRGRVERHGSPTGTIVEVYFPPL